ncbi:hypothetical protein LSAT2_006729, partial [Lamellibrachia satsuma]
MNITFLYEATRDEIRMDRNHLRDDADFNRNCQKRPENTATSSTTETREHSHILYYGDPRTPPHPLLRRPENTATSSTTETREHGHILYYGDP